MMKLIVDVGFRGWEAMLKGYFEGALPPREEGAKT